MEMLKLLTLQHKRYNQISQNPGFVRNIRHSVSMNFYCVTSQMTLRISAIGLLFLPISPDQKEPESKKSHYCGHNVLQNLYENG